MNGIHGTRTRLALVAVAVLAGCDAGAPDARVPVLTAKVETQASEIDALRRSVKDLDARSRVLEERLAAARSSPAPATTASPAAPAPAADPAVADAPAAPVSTPTTEAVAAFLDTEQGRQKLAEAMETAEKRRTEKAEQDQQDRMKTAVKERVTGYLTEQLNLDSAQQQAVLAVAMDTTEKMSEVWRGMRDNRGDPAAIATAREKSNEIRREATEKIQQSLTVDQFNKFQEIMADGGGGFLMGGGRGAAPAGAAGGTRGGR